jgi:DNA-binding XRE family transcriptional regulator
VSEKGKVSEIDQSALDQSALGQTASNSPTSSAEQRQAEVPFSVQARAIDSGPTSSAAQRRVEEFLDQHPEAARIAFGLRLRQLRSERGLSQDNLAARTDVHPTAIARFERGAREPRLTTILRLARGLEVPPGALLEGLVWPVDKGSRPD